MPDERKYESITINGIEGLANLMRGGTDYVVSATSFLAVSARPDVEPQRFTLMILTDKETVERGVKMPGELIVAMFDRFRYLMCKACGEQMVDSAMLHAMMGMLQAELVEDNETITPPMELH